MSALDGWMDIFRAGEHTDSAGDKRTWSQTELDSMVSALVRADPAPVVVGHPETDAPAYAWVAGIRRMGDRLQAKLRDIDPAFREAVEAGRYSARSVALEGDGEAGYRLRHLGFLGGRAPAVSGLSPTQFSGAPAPTYTFAGAETGRWGFKALGRVLRRWRERVIEKEGVAAADALVSEWDIETVAGAGEADDERPQFTAPPAPEPIEPEEQEEDDMSKEHEQLQAAELEAEQQKLEAEREALVEREAAFAAKERRREAHAALDEHVSAGRVLPGEHEGLAAFMAALPDDEAGETLTSPPPRAPSRRRARAPSSAPLSSASRNASTIPSARPGAMRRPPIRTTPPRWREKRSRSWRAMRPGASPSTARFAK